MKIVKLGNYLGAGEMIKKDPKLCNIADCQMETPLHWAAKRGYQELVDLLMVNGANYMK